MINNLYENLKAGRVNTDGPFWDNSIIVFDENGKVLNEGIRAERDYNNVFISLYRATRGRIKTLKKQQNAFRDALKCYEYGLQIGGLDDSVSDSL